LRGGFLVLAALAEGHGCDVAPDVGIGVETDVEEMGPCRW